ncbi:MAG: TonB-dependent receptor, partial [Marinirhabdus sp.]
MIRSKLMEKHNTFLKFNPFKTPPRAALPIACMLLSVALSAQEDNLGTEVVNVVKPYTPTISDAFKVKETPVLNDSLAAPKQEVRYGIFSVPVASTFTPAKGKATKVAKAEKIRQYDNYVTLGFGNFTTVLGELYSNFEISRTDNAGFFFRHSSSQGGIDNVRLENKYYNTQLDGNYTSRERDLTLRLDGGAKHQLYNWYGLNSTYGTLTEGTIANFDAQQTYVSGNIGGTVALEGSFFEKATASLRYLTDAHSSSEFHATFQPEFSFPANNFSFAVKGDVDYVTGSFDRGYLAQQGTAYSNVNLGLIPGLVYVNSDLTLNLGIAAYAGLDLENSDMDIYLFPRVLASYRLSGDRAIVYGGAKGGLHQNTYYDFKEANPFVSPTLSIHPTQQLYDIYGGLKGKINNSIAYNLRGSYGKEEDKALLRNNPDFADRTQVLQGYELGNSFGTIYDNVNTFSVFGE